MAQANLADPAVAADYDLIYTDWDTQVERLVGIMSGHLPVIPGGRLLDASCGSGLSVDAARRAGWIVTGCDTSPAMLQRARDRFPDVTFRASSLLVLRETMGARYDAVISVGNALTAIPHDQVPRALGELRACLRDGGALMIAIRDFSERLKGGVWRDDPVARVQARFVYRDGDVIYALDIDDARGQRTHEQMLHPISPLELEAAVLASGFTVQRSSRAAGRAVVAGRAV
jgi:SAM-dependent methyltransferase